MIIGFQLCLNINDLVNETSHFEWMTRHLWTDFHKLDYPEVSAIFIVHRRKKMPKNFFWLYVYWQQEGKFCQNIEHYLNYRAQGNPITNLMMLSRSLQNRHSEILLRSNAYELMDTLSGMSETVNTCTEKTSFLQKHGKNF